MARRKAFGLFIADAEIRQRVDDVLPTVLTKLDANSDTQHKATMPAGKRSRKHVNEWLKTNGFDTANDQT